MHKSLLTAIALLCGVSLFAQQYAKCKILLNGQDIAALAALGIEADHGEWVPQRHFISDFSTSEIQQIKDAGFTVEVLVNDVERWYANQQVPAYKDQAVASKVDAVTCGTTIDLGDYPKPAHMTTGSMGGYFTYEEMLAILDSMHALYPQFVTARTTISDTLLTHEGRPLYWVKISDNPNQDENEPEALYDAVHHAREPLSMTQLIYFMWYLLENYETDPKVKAILDHTELYFVPCVNPDGYIFNQTNSPNGGGLWRKNRRVNGGGNFGVDINRNYGYFWGNDNIGSSPNPNSDTYRGPSAFSEPETRLMRDFCLQHQFINALNYHTYSNVLLYPFAYNNTTANPYLPVLAKAMVLKNNYATGTTANLLGYDVNGDSNDWMYGEQSINAYVPEVGPAAFGFWPPANTIDSLSKVTQFSNMVMAWSLLDLALLEDKSGKVFNTATFQIPILVKNISNHSATYKVSLEGLGSDVLSVTPALHEVTLDMLGTQEVVFTVTLNSNLPKVKDIHLVQHVDNAYFVLSDTLEKQYINGVLKTVYTNNMLSNQTVSGNWALTLEKSYSPPSSFTDSPNEDYQANNISVGNLNSAITLPADAVAPELHFFAQWDVENNYDWVQLDATTDNSEFYTLCGLFTNGGSQFQPQGIPLWDGYQGTWVEEQVNLEDLKGKTFTLAFSLYSDGETEGDGYYVDNLQAVYYDTTSTSNTINLATWASTNVALVPNPAQEQAALTWSIPAALNDVADRLTLVNAQGQTVSLLALPATESGTVRLPLSELPNGVYTVNLFTRQGTLAVKRLVVMH